MDTWSNWMTTTDVAVVWVDHVKAKRKLENRRWFRRR